VRIREFAPGKVNLCLFLGPVRADGRHELVTLYQTVSLSDELVISDGPVDEVIAPGIEGPNLVSGAVAGLRRLGWQGPPLRIEIEKRIPVAAGMGGGSADAAALLRVAPRLAPVDADGVAEVAASLGADVPAQLEPGVALGAGAGEIVSRRPPLAPHALTIVPLGHALLTAEVYAEADRLGLARGVDELRARLEQLQAAVAPGVRLPDELLVNDLQPAAMSLCPAVGGALDAVREAGAERALVCGSGPTVAGVHWGADAEARAHEAASALVSRFPRVTVALPVSSPS
jgi:4-diphosphocytidyl-2-C-methyl-D-erythritol kinase